MRRQRRSPLATAHTVLLTNPGSELYGADRMALESVRALRREGYRVVVTVPEDGPLCPPLIEAGASIELCQTPILRKKYLSMGGILLLLRDAASALPGSVRLLRRSAADVVIVNTITSPLWLPLARIMGRRVACHVHEAEGSANPAIKRLLYLPLFFADRIVINSDFALSVLTDASPHLARRANVVHNAVAGPRAASAPRTELTGRIRLLFMGRLSARKGPHVAIEAVRRLVDHGLDVHLTVLGAVFDGNDDYLEQLHDLVREGGLSDRVSLAGFQPSIWPEVEKCDIVLIPSTVDEPFGNTAVEASLGARPLVVSDIAGLQEASSQANSVVRVPPQDADAIASAVEEIHDAWSDFASMAVRDAQRVSEYFSSDRYRAGLLNATGLSKPTRDETPRLT